MIGKRLVLHGAFVEAYLYFDFLWLFSSDGNIRAFDIAAYCAERLNGEGAAAAALFSDNRILEDGRDPGVIHLAERMLATGGRYDVSAEEVDRFSYIFERSLEFRSLLDVRFYYGRAYIGTDASIEQFNATGVSASHEKRGAVAKARLNSQRVSDRPARAFHGRFGAVAAACGKAGGLIGLGADDVSPGFKIRFDKFAETSYGVAINGTAVTNLAARTRTQIYGARLEPKRARPGVDGEEHGRDRQFTLAAVSSLPLERPTEQVNRLAANDETRGVFLFNQSVWRFDAEGKSQIVKMGENPQLDSISTSSPKDGPPGRVLSMSTTKGGVIAETDDAVFVQRYGEWKELLSEPVHSVRGYQNSKRYQRLATAVARTRIELISI